MKGLRYFALLVLCCTVATPARASLSTHALCNTTSGMCIGIRDEWGGAVTDLQTPWSFTAYFWNSNLISNGWPDPGRQIQVDMYTAGQSYPTSCWPCNSGCHWGWNPVQGGNCAFQGSGVTQVISGSNYLYTRTQPLHWDNELGRSNVTIEQTLQFVLDNTVKITYVITNNESFAIQGASHDVPVAYLRTVLSQAVAYTGSSPFTYGPITTFQIANNSVIYPAPTERWVAWLDPAIGKGVALYVPAQSYWPTWGMGRLGSANVPPTNYMQMWGGFDLAPGQKRTAIAYIITGSVAEIRASVYALEGV